MTFIEDLVNKSIANSNGFIFYDSDCRVCKKSTIFVSNLLLKSGYRARTYTLNFVRKKQENILNEFYFIFNGNIYTSHLAWLKMFSLCNFPWSLCKYLKNPYIIQIVFYIYKIISKLRKTNCNC